MNDISSHHTDIRAQYAQDSGAVFYRHVMGDGAPVIHYGIYQSAATTMRDATSAATDRLLEIATGRSREKNLGTILDLGAGPGGPAHRIAARTGAHVTCVDLCEHYNQENERTAAQHGLAEMIGTWCGSFERLPDDWNDRFDLVWSQEAICHAADPAAALREAFRVLRPGGVLVFSDILLADGVDDTRAAVFKQVNAVTTCRTVSEMMKWLSAAGFDDIEHEDWSDHLPENFRRMRRQIDRFRDEMCAAGVDARLLDRFAASLDERLTWPVGSVLRWGAFICAKPCDTPARPAAS